jgi:chromate reductase
MPPRLLAELGRRIGAADGVMIASPEYNFSLPRTIKNAIDWVSRITVAWKLAAE